MLSLHFVPYFLHLLLWLLRVVFMVSVSANANANVMLQQRHGVFALAVPVSVPCHPYFFHFARILNRFR